MFCFTNSVGIDYSHGFGDYRRLSDRRCTYLGLLSRKIWSQLICVFLLIPVKVRGREKIHKHTSYVFVPNHQGAFDIFLIYGFLGRNFKWMMKKSLREITFRRESLRKCRTHICRSFWSQESIGNHSPGKGFAKRRRIIGCVPGRCPYFTGHMGYFKKVHSSWQMNCSWKWCRSLSTDHSKFCPARKMDTSVPHDTDHSRSDPAQRTRYRKHQGDDGRSLRRRRKCFTGRIQGNGEKRGPIIKLKIEN